MLKSLPLILLLSISFPAAAQQVTATQSFELASKINIEDDADYSPRLEKPAYQKDGPVVLLDQAHGNPQFDKAFAKLVSTDGYQVVASKSKLTFEDLSKVRVLVIMNPGLFISLQRIENPQPLFSDVEASAVRDWVIAGGAVLFASNLNRPESGEMLLSRLGVEFIREHFVDMEMASLPSPVKSPFVSRTFTREKNKFANHPVMAGRSETERVDEVAVNGFKAIRKFPENAIVLIRSSDKSIAVPRDTLAQKQLLEAAQALKSGAEKQTPPITTPRMTPIPMPGIPVAVAFILGKGRVVVIGNASALSSVVQDATFQGQPISQKIGLSDSDNEKFTLNTMHWLSGIME